MATYLADTSALARLDHPDVVASISPLLLRGRVATCRLIDLEILFTARNAGEHSDLDLDRAFYPRVPCGDEAMDRAVEVQWELAHRGRLRSVPITDLIIAAAAELAGLTVLHYDADFDTIAGVTGQPTEWVVPKGTVP